MPTAEDALKSIKTRMESFIEAAYLIADKSGATGVNFDGVIGKFLTEGALRKIEKDIGKIGIKEALSKHMKKFNDALIKEMRSSIPDIEDKSTYKRVMGGDKNIFKQLMDAENYLNMGKREPIVSVEDRAGNVIGRSDPNGGFQVFNKDTKEWKSVDSKEKMLASIREQRGDKVFFVREENPITKFTQEQTREWLSILEDADRPEELKGLGSDKPDWFTDLPKWEQKLYQDKVKEWQKMDKAERGNLGDYLGSIPSTIRKYPGAPNAYVTSVDVYKPGEEKPKRIFEKVRSGAVIAFDLEEPDRTRLTQQNLEQLMADTLRRKLEGVESGKVSIPMAIQTLFSPPFQPDGGDDALAKSVASIQYEIMHNQKGFLKRIGVEVPEGVELTIQTGYSNIPVNNARGISSIIGGRKSSSARMLSECVSEDPELAKQVLHRLANADWHGESLFSSYKAQKYNFNSERAALEQILNFAKGGNRIGSCVSGKDREEMVTEMAVAMVMFRETHGNLPPPPGLNKHECEKLGIVKEGYSYEQYKQDRDEFEVLVANQFLANHGQQIAAANSKGSDGLKNVNEVYGKAICQKIKALAAKDGLDPLQETKARAGLNKPKISNKGLGHQIKGFFKNLGKLIGGILAVASVITVVPVVLAVTIVSAVDGVKRIFKDKELSSDASRGLQVEQSRAEEQARAEGPEGGVMTSSAPSVMDGNGLRGALSRLGDDLDVHHGASAPSKLEGMPKIASSPPSATPLATVRERVSAPAVSQEQQVRHDASAPARRSSAPSSLKNR